MFYFSSEILCCVSGYQMKTQHINFIYLNIFENYTFFGKQREFTIKIKHVGNVVWSFLKKKIVFIILAVVVNSAEQIFLQKTFEEIKTFILTGCHEYLYISVCIWYDDSFIRMKWWNYHEVTLRLVLEKLFVCLCPHWDVTRASVCVCAKGKRASLPSIHTLIRLRTMMLIRSSRSVGN